MPKDKAATPDKPSKALQPPKAEPRLPTDRASLLALHAELRHRRDALPLNDERADVLIELARVEVQVARIERAMDPPLG
jgi:hypothetical protein